MEVLSEEDGEVWFCIVGNSKQGELVVRVLQIGEQEDTILRSDRYAFSSIIILSVLNIERLLFCRSLSIFMTIVILHDQIYEILLMGRISMLKSS